VFYVHEYAASENKGQPLKVVIHCSSNISQHLKKLYPLL